MSKLIAERKLFYTEKNSSSRKEFSVGIGEPYLVDPKTVNFDVGQGVFGCQIKTIGLDTEPYTAYGADSLQAANLASNAVDFFLKQLQKKYDFFYQDDGSPYFSE